MVLEGYENDHVANTSHIALSVYVATVVKWHANNIEKQYDRAMQPVLY